MSCATSADALLGGGIVSAAGLRVAMRSWLPTMRERLSRPADGERTDDSADDHPVPANSANAHLRSAFAPHPA